MLFIIVLITAQGPKGGRLASAPDPAPNLAPAAPGPALAPDLTSLALTPNMALAAPGFFAVLMPRVCCKWCCCTLLHLQLMLHVCVVGVLLHSPPPCSSIGYVMYVLFIFMYSQKCVVVLVGYVACFIYLFSPTMQQAHVLHS